MKQSLLLLCFLLFSIGHAIGQAEVTVTFRVDLNGIKTDGPVGIRGNLPPLAWDRTYPLQDPDGDRVYEGVVTVPGVSPESVLEYKFVYGDKQLSWELASGPNRLLVLNSDQIETPLARWNVATPIEVAALPKVSAEDLLADFRIAKKALLTLHPGLYRYRSEEEIDELFALFEEKMNRPLSYREAYLLYSEMLAQIRCGHTYANFWNQSGLIQEVVFNQTDKLPLTFRIVEGRMIVTHNLSGQEELEGMPEIVAINGVPAAEILRNLQRYVKADGSNDAKRLADLNLYGLGPSESFDIYFPLRYPPVDGRYELDIESAEGRAVQLAVPAITRAERARRLQAQHSDLPTTADDLWKLEFWDDGAAYLQLGTFVVFDLSFEWKDFLDDAFAQIRKRKSPKLVLDLRGNEGGQDEILLYLAKMLAKGPVSVVPRQDYVRYEQVSADLRPYLSTWADDAYDLRGKVKKEANGLYRLEENGEIQVKPSSKAYQGKVYLLVDAANSSATFYFAELAQRNALATLVGQPTGGSQKGMNGGVMFFVRLPHSRIEFDIPLIGAFSPELPDEGIRPDVEVFETVESLRAGVDPVLEKVRGR